MMMIMSTMVSFAPLVDSSLPTCCDCSAFLNPTTNLAAAARLVVGWRNAEQSQQVGSDESTRGATETIVDVIIIIILVTLTRIILTLQTDGSAHLTAAACSITAFDLHLHLHLYCHCIITCNIVIESRA